MISHNLIENGISEAAAYAGMIPGVCLISGFIKVIYGVVKMIFNNLKAVCQEAESEQVRKFYNEANCGWEHIKDGCLEIFHIKFATIAFVASVELLSCCCNSSFLNDQLYNYGILA
ncbi:MAG: hypothetical protein H0T62_04065 [Parachlamydiaceae bacterium]|nr:hypothetical protein [Parachlamydiaceae bacterium]